MWKVAAFFSILTSNHNVRASLVRAASVVASSDGVKSAVEQLTHYPNVKGSSLVATAIVWLSTMTYYPMVMGLRPGAGTRR